MVELLRKPAGSAVAPEQTGHPVWGLGFRPFFLLGLLAAALLIAAWVGVLGGTVPPPAIDPVTWHAHEMIFGFVLAIVAGFLLTASQNWTGIRGVHGLPLQVLAGLWLAGRIVMWPYPGLLAAAIDLAFLPYLAWLMRPYLTIPTQRRNRVFLVFFALLFAANAIVHADLLHWWPGAARSGLWLGVYVILLIVALIGGRVIPFFTRNAVPGARVRTRTWVERLSAVTAAALVPTAFLPADSDLARGVALAAAIVHGVRWVGWFDWPMLRRPILAILYAGYAWLVAGFALLAILPGVGQPPALALHAFTVGGIGVMIYGMVSRITLGHTGRPIQAAPVVLVGYVAMNLAALLRVAGPLAFPSAYYPVLAASGTLWAVAFLLLLMYYAPILLRPREVG